MRMISNEELNLVAGGADNESEIQIVEIHASQADVQAARAAYAADQVASQIAFAEAVACAKAMTSVQAKPTVINAVIAASACGTAATSVVKATDWTQFGGKDTGTKLTGHYQ